MFDLVGKNKINFRSSLQLHPLRVTLYEHKYFRIFKLARHSTGLQALGNTMKSNYKELGLLFLLLGMGAIMFASLIYVFEKEDNDSTFKTMFDAYWWAIITMTTVIFLLKGLFTDYKVNIIIKFCLN